MRHAAILLKPDEKPENKEGTGKAITKAHNTNENSVMQIAKRFAEEGLESALNHKPQENHSRKIGGDMQSECDCAGMQQTAGRL